MMGNVIAETLQAYLDEVLSVAKKVIITDEYGVAYEISVDEYKERIKPFLMEIGGL